MPKAPGIIVGEGVPGAIEREVRVLAGPDGFSNQPGAGHAQMREQVGAIRENKIQHLALAFDGGNGLTFYWKLGVENVFSQA